MATWKNRGYSAPVQVYDPDLSFLTQASAVSQARFDKGFNAFKSVYDSMLNSELTNDSNKAYRSEVFKRLEENLKRTSSLDFSRPENIKTALGILDPLTKEADFAYDLSVSRYHKQQKQLMNSYKNSEDAEKRKLYNPIAEQAIFQAEEKLRNAKRGDGSIQKASAQEFVMFEDITGYLNERAKDAGLEIKISRTDPSGYIVTNTNGEQAVPYFTAWAASQMGNRFDRQLGLTAKVTSENQIKGLMQTGNLSRQDAVMQLAQEVLPEYKNQKLTDVTSLKKDLNYINREIEILEKTFGAKGVPVTLDYIKDNYDNLVEQKKIHEQLIANGADSLKKINEDEVGYISNNLEYVLKESLYKQNTLAWAASTAMATAEQEVKSDATWVSKFNNQIKMKIHQDNMLSKAVDDDLANERLKLDWYKAMNTTKGGKGSSSGSGVDGPPTILGEDAVSTYLGSSLTPQAMGNKVDLLGNRINYNYETLFQAVIGEGNGLLQLVVPENEFHKAREVLYKVKSIADGKENIKLTDSENAYLVKMGQRITGGTIDPTKMNRAGARELIQAVGSGLYEKANEQLKAYSKTGNISKIADVNAFKTALASLQGIAEDEESIDRSIKNIAAVLTQDADGLYKNKEVIGFTSDNTPIYDLSKLSPEEKKRLEPFIAGQFEKLVAPVGQEYDFAGLTANELNMLISTDGRADAKSKIYDEDGNQVTRQEIFGNLVNAPLADVASLFGDRMSVIFDPVNKQVKAKVSISPTSNYAKSQKIKTTQSYTFVLPYDQLLSDTGALSNRFKQGIKTNTVEVEGAGIFSPFLSNKNARIQSPSYYDNAGYSFDIIGTTNNKGQYGLSIDIKYNDPFKGDKGKEVTEHHFHPIAEPNNPSSYAGLSEQMNMKFIEYLRANGQMLEVLDKLEKIQLKTP